MYTLPINDIIVTDTFHWPVQESLSNALPSQTLCFFFVRLCPTEHNQVSARSCYLPAHSVLNAGVSLLAFSVIEQRSVVVPYVPGRNRRENLVTCCTGNIFAIDLLAQT